MDETASPRVIVGVTGSLASLAALRRAVAEARARMAALYVVHACRVDSGDPVMSQALRERRTAAAAAALDDIGTWLGEALGGPPAVVALHLSSIAGPPPGPALVRQVRAETDLLVVGRPRRGLGLFSPNSVAAYCVRRAACPVLVVPPPQLAREFGGRTRLRRRIDRALVAELQARSDPQGQL